MKPAAVAMATTSQIAKIHVLAGRAGLEGETYQDFLERETGNRSSKQCTAAEAGRVIDKLAVLAGQHRATKGVSGLDTPVGSKLRALWIAGYDLGVVQVRDDQAMLAFLQRQTGVSHIRFLREPGAATSAIEGLKAWLAREAKVQWPAPADIVSENGVIESKRAVINAQWMRLVEIGAVVPIHCSVPLGELDAYAAKITWKHGWGYYAPADYDQVQKALGNKLRKALAQKAGA